ncbi:MAG: response regulator [Desulfovibrionales bacterium]
MAIITMFSEGYCQEDEVAKNVAGAMSLAIVEDKGLIVEASEKYGVPEEKFYRALFGKPSVFNVFTKDKERCVSCYKAVLAERLQEEDLLLKGFGGFLVPKTITHVLKVCLTADKAYRVEVARKAHHLDPRQLAKLIAQEEEVRSRWAEYLLLRGPWDSSLYDILIPMDKTTPEDAAELIQNRARRSVTLPTVESLQAARDFALAAKVEAALAMHGYILRTEARKGRVVVRVERNVVRPERIQEELAGIVRGVAGEVEVEVKIGTDLFQTNVYRPFDFEQPSKVLVVDDEQDFAATLSERLKMREMGAAVVSSGEEALELIEEDEPEVVILDLKMPGIDGEDVLRMIRKGHPRIQVIILSGQGDRDTNASCLRLGAFACLQKPVDFKELTETIRRAYVKLEDG